MRDKLLVEVPGGSSTCTDGDTAIRKTKARASSSKKSFEDERFRRSAGAAPPYKSRFVTTAAGVDPPSVASAALADETDGRTGVSIKPLAS